jgi:hypothetical protein
MKSSRRNILRGGLSLVAAATAPEIVLSSAIRSPGSRAKSKTGYSRAEIDDRLKSGKGQDGVTKADLVTPALILDLDLLDANIAKMAAHAKASKINLRPHGKTHKCVEIAQRQIKAGAIGLCVATIREAEAMSAAGVKRRDRRHPGLRRRRARHSDTEQPEPGFQNRRPRRIHHPPLRPEREFV